MHKPVSKKVITHSFEQPKENEWVQPTPKAYLMKCCDCGLVHEVDFRVIKYYKGQRTKVQFRMRRHGGLKMSEPLSEILGIKELERMSNFRNAQVALGYEQAISDLNQLSLDVEELAFLIYFHCIPSSNLEMARRLWKEEMADCEKYRKIAQEIINKMSVWIVKKG